MNPALAAAQSLARYVRYAPWRPLEPLTRLMRESATTAQRFESRPKRRGG